MEVQSEIMLKWIIGFLIVGVVGCSTGGGEGWVVGSVNVDTCNAKKYVEQDFDLKIDFFAGDLLIDSSNSPNTRRDSLTIRLQPTSNTMEQSDGLLIELHDLVAIAQQFAEGKAIPVSIDDSSLVHSQLHLFSTCPDNGAPLCASNEVFVSDASGECLQPNGEEKPACPEISPADEDDLERLCRGEFDQNTTENSAQINGLLGGGACLYMCELGLAQRGQDPAQLENFEMDYGKMISAIFSFNLVDARAIELGTCSRGFAQLNGMFRFKLSRSRVAQAFP
ncbi:MAG: hypothetical protein V1754_14500 [Pseudomonadota bacterium]